MLIVRAEAPADYAAVREVNERAFGRAEEADLVDAIRRNGRARVSLVAERGGRVVGHILFSPVTIGPAARAVSAVGLAPMAVLPEFQKQGVGSGLVRRGLEECRALGVEAVVVIGHAEFYPRFGFAPAKGRGLACEYDVPEEVFMVAELREGALEGARGGTVRYGPEFAGL